MFTRQAAHRHPKGNLRNAALPTLLVAALLVCFGATSATAAPPYLANGIKIGEVDSTSAIVWIRTTAQEYGDTTVVDAAPGHPGQVRVAYRPKGTEAPLQSTPWVATDPSRDFTAQVQLESLEPATRYEIHVETRADDSSNAYTIDGGFTTAPTGSQAQPVRLAVVTCQAIGSIDSGQNGHYTYRLLDQLRPDFFVHTGDIVYYDKAPLCKTIATARNKWNRMYAFGYQRDFHRNTASYFIKDDHDTLKNDCWPGQTYGDLTFDQGLAIFREQVPMGEKTYRTYRWGKDLQVWMVENRDFRSPNNMPDGPDKTIWGHEQKQWLFDTMQKSDATFKLLLSPGPLVGPDKRGKADNHSNDCFQHEGQQAREFLAGLGNAFVVNGDRHWQYHSVDPKTGLKEFGCGPINDAHDYGGNSGFKEEYHRYFDPGGGCLLITVTPAKGQTPARITFTYHAVPDQPTEKNCRVRYETSFDADELSGGGQ